MLCRLRPLKDGRRRMEDLHRVFAFNYKRCNWKPLRWSAAAEMHHRGKRKNVSKKSTWQNMSVMTDVVHAQWHRKYG